VAASTSDPTVVVPYSLLDPSVPATLPAAVAEQSPAEDPDPALATSMTHLSERFFQQIGDHTADPHDTAYQRRWLEAQEEIDARMRASHGGHAWLNYHRETNRHKVPPAR
jgi:hypothetical protein